jgi:hypothetical protein
VDFLTAQQNANASTYKGIQGYLATITEPQESNFILLNWYNFGGSSVFIGATNIKQPGIGEAEKVKRIKEK